MTSTEGGETVADGQFHSPQQGALSDRRSGPSEQELASRSVEVTAGAGAVRVRVDGRGRLKLLVIDPEAFEQRDAELLADLIQGAIAEGQRRAADLSQGDR